MNVQLTPSSTLNATISAPPSKSMAHRSFLAAALCHGASHISNLVFSKDMEATLAALPLLGATVEREESAVTITGNGGQFPSLPSDTLVDCIESGSTLRFLIPLFTHTDSTVTFTGRGRLMERPQEVYQKLFHEKGLSFSQSEDKLTISCQFEGGNFTLDGSVSSQFITGLLFTLPLLPQDSTLHITEPFESRSYVELTRQTLEDFGITTQWDNPNTLYIKGNQTFKAHDYVVEGDCSQAAFWAVLGAIKGGVSIAGIRPDTLQGDHVIFDILQKAGAKYTLENNVYHYHAASLQGTQIDLADCPDLGPILMVMGLFAQGETKIYNAGRLRVKESDRIEAMLTEIKKMGGSMSVEGDTITLSHSTLSPRQDLFSHNDHRIAMAMAVASMASGNLCTISMAEAVEKSYPDFWEVVANAKVSVSKEIQNKS